MIVHSKRKVFFIYASVYYCYYYFNTIVQKTYSFFDPAYNPKIILFYVRNLSKLIIFLNCIYIFYVKTTKGVDRPFNHENFLFGSTSTLMFATIIDYRFPFHRYLTYIYIYISIISHVLYYIIKRASRLA